MAYPEGGGASAQRADEAHEVAKEGNGACKQDSQVIYNRRICRYPVALLGRIGVLWANIVIPHVLLEGKCTCAALGIIDGDYK